MLSCLPRILNAIREVVNLMLSCLPRIMNLIGNVTDMRKELLERTAELLKDTIQLRERFQSLLEPIEDLLALRRDTSDPL